MKKNILKIFAYAFCAASLFMTASCSNTVITRGNQSNMAAISLGSDSRTIGSTVSNVTDFTNLVLKYAEKDSSDEKSLASWDSSSSKSAYEIACKDVVYLPAGTYDFYLYGTKGNFTYRGTHLNKTVVISDDRLVNHLEFDMEQFQIVAGSGNGSLKVTLDVPSTVSYAMVGLVDKSGNAISGYGAEKIFATKETEESTNARVVYEKASVPSGSYRVNFVLYSADGILLGYYREICNIAAGDLSTGTRSIETLNDLYTINYVENGGSFTSGTAPGNYSRLSPVTSMPAIKKSYFRFDGWYDNADFTGSSVTSLTSGNVTLYAKFRIKATINSVIREWSGDGSDIIAVSDAVSKTWSELSVAEVTSTSVAELTGSDAFASGYDAFMPADKKGTSVDYTGQMVASNGSTSHLDAFNYFVGKGSSEGILTMNAVGGRVKLAMTGVPSGKMFTKVVMYAPNYKFLTKGTVNFSNGALTATESKEHFEIDLNNITTSDGSLTVYAMVPPVDVGTYGSAGNKIVITLVDSSNNYYMATISNTESAGVTINKGLESVYNISMEALPHYITMNGVKVATHNIGAYSPYEEGNYYSYSEAKTAFADDSVFASNYRLMTYEEAEKLSSLTTSQNNSWVHGISLKENTNTVTFSARGYYDSSSFENDNMDGNFWLSDEYDSSEAFAMYVIKNGVGITTWGKSLKFNVRPVYSK